MQNICVDVKNKKVNCCLWLLSVTFCVAPWLLSGCQDLLIKRKTEKEKKKFKKKKKHFVLKCVYSACHANS